jgi:hypothetical protein
VPASGCWARTSARRLARCGDIDVMEHVRSHPNVVHSTVHLLAATQQALEQDTIRVRKPQHCLSTSTPPVVPRPNDFFLDDTKSTPPVPRVRASGGFRPSPAIAAESRIRGNLCAKSVTSPPFHKPTSSSTRVSSKPETGAIRDNLKQSTTPYEAEIF